MLNRCRRQLLADRFDQAFALVPVVVVDADLDQLVTVQTAADFSQYRVGKTVLADGDDGLQGMRPRAQGTTLGGSDFKHWRDLSKRPFYRFAR